MEQPAPIPVCPGCGVIAPTAQARCALCGASFGDRPAIAPGGAPQAMFARMRLDFECPGCGARSPVAPSLDDYLECSECKAKHKLSRPEWQEAFEYAHTVADLCHGRAPAAPNNPFHFVGETRTFSERPGRLLHLQATPGHPLCPDCHVPLQMGRNGGSAWHASCAQCGRHVPCGLPPRAYSVVPDLLAMLDTEKHGDIVAMQCPTCGAALSVARGTETVTCRYCQATSRIQLRAALDAFWALFGGTSKWRANLERAPAAKPRPQFDSDAELERIEEQEEEERRIDEADATRSSIAQWAVFGFFMLVGLILTLAHACR